MAVTNVQIAHDGWSGDQDDKGKVDFSVTFLVEVDDREDGPQTAATADDGTTKIPAIGNFYEIGNDVDHGALVKKVSPRPLSGKMWSVAVTYGPASAGDEKGDSEPRDTSDAAPKVATDWQDVNALLMFQLIRTSRAAWQGVYKGQLIKFKNQFATFFDRVWAGGPATENHAKDMKNPLHFGLKNGVAITNSANCVFDPPVEKDYFRIGITVVRNHESFPTAALEKFTDTVNLKEITIDLRRAKITIPKGAGKMQSITGDWRVMNGSPYWRVSFEIHIDFFFGWHHDILDRGLHRDGSVDEDGNSTSEADWKKHKAPVEAIKDSQGHPITEPVKLDGAGQPLKPDNALGIEAVFLRYMLYPELDWTELKLSQKQPFID